VLILWAIPVGILAGLALGGRTERLSHLHFRWPWLALGGLLIQVGLFSETGFALAGGLAPLIYVASTAVVLIAVVRNLPLAGMPVVALGAAANLAAILANAGAMPADPGALALAGLTEGGHTNSVVVASPALQPLTDIFAVPAWVPLANVFSVGDVLIAIGIAWAVAAAMRSGPSEAAGGPAAG
jgi:Family of unknown function (DUF5317)